MGVISKSIPALAGILLALAVPSSAGAAVSCDYDGLALTLDVKLGSDGDSATIVRLDAGSPGQEDDEIAVRRDIVVPVACAGFEPTAGSVDLITVTQRGNIEGDVTLDYRNEENAFSPGATGAGKDGPGKTREIEIDVRLGPGDDDLTFDGTRALVGGDEGFNPNVSAEEIGPDADLLIRGVESIESDESEDPSGSVNLVDFRGGPCCGDPLALPTKISGGEGADIVYGGKEHDLIDAGIGDDLLSGGRGNDELFGDLGFDTLLGKGGRDRLHADDGAADAKINCGKGNDRKASFDSGLDPKPKSC